MWEVLLDKLLVPQIFKKLSSFYGSGSYISENNLMLTTIAVILHVSAKFFAIFRVVLIDRHCYFLCCFYHI
jgi:hypothetical protein